MLDDIGPDLDEAHAKIEVTRDELQDGLDGQEAPDERPGGPGRLGLDRMAAEVERVEDALRLASPWARRSLSSKLNGPFCRPRSRPTRAMSLPSVHYWPSVW